MRSLGPVLVAIVAALAILTASPLVLADDDDVTLEGYVSSVIKGDDTFLRGAEIVATGTDEKTYKATTNNDGYFIMSCPQGTYTLLVKCSGFEPITVDNVESGGDTVEIHMELRDMSILWGLDIPHTLEVIGLLIVLGVLIAGIVIAHVLRRSSKITVIGEEDEPLVGLDDLEDMEEVYEEEEYVYDEDLKDS